MLGRFLVTASFVILSSTASVHATEIGTTVETPCPFGDCAAGISSPIWANSSCRPTTWKMVLPWAASQDLISSPLPVAISPSATTAPRKLLLAFLILISM